MNTNKSQINIVWFKRDLRLHDNEALYNAMQSNLPIVLLYVFEKSLRNDTHYSSRHWNFIKQSIVCLNEQLKPYNTEVLAVEGEVIQVINTILENYSIKRVFSHQETGIRITYERDKAFRRFCKNNQIDWVENINNGIFRGLQNRNHWEEQWQEYMNAPLFEFLPKSNSFLSPEHLETLANSLESVSLETYPDSIFQKGGTVMGNNYLNTFFQERYVNYNRHISKPLLGRKGCSRLSPYLSWGNLSVREVWQKAMYFKPTCSNPKALDSFISRLHWQAHFIQKFEMESVMEFESINKGYHELKKKINPIYIDAWKNGQTGFPMVDAAMRCLNTTGYLNFRMRALLVSFFTLNLWQPWQAASRHLSQQFLDFEPGIHFPQLQMQAGETGVNLLRIYNPAKNSLEHDPDGAFLKQWLPELQDLPLPFVHEPYKMTVLDQKFHHFELGKNYPKPIVNLERTRKFASDYLWKMKKSPLVVEESSRILKLHSLVEMNPTE